MLQVIGQRARQLIVLIRREGPRGAGRRVVEGMTWRWNRLLWTTSERVPAVASTRRFLSRFSRRVAGRSARRSLGVDTMVRASSVLGGLAELASSDETATGETVSVADAPTKAVAVVVPAFQAEEWLDDCLTSVARQSYRHWRCYIVDDASSDETAAIGRRWESRDSRFRLIRHGRNGGLSSARNTGLREAVEPIVTFLDADDLLVPDSLERRVRVLEREWDNPAVAGAWSTTPQVPEETPVDFAAAFSREATGEVVHFAASRGECPFNAHAPVVRTELLRSLGGFDESMKRGAEDWDLWQRLLRYGYVFQPAGGIAGLYRQRRASMVREDPSGHLREARRLLDDADAWAETTPELVVDPIAAAPLAVLARGERALLRAATYAGIHVGSSGTPTALDEPAFIEFLEPVTTAQALARPVGDASTGGLNRGLGLGIASSRLTAEDKGVVADVSRSIVERLAGAAAQVPAPEPGPTTVDLRVRRWSADLLFVAETSADVVAYLPMIEAAVARGQSVAAVDLDVVKGDEGAAARWAAQDIPVHPFNHLAFGRVAVGSIVVRRPLGPVTEELCRQMVDVPVVELEAGDRLLELECNERHGFSTTTTVTADDVIETAPGALPPSPMKTNYGRLLLKEEGTVDPASRALLCELHDKHRGETVVIVGNGPSLNETPIEALGGVPTFAVNGIFYAAERFPDPITYYVVEDTSVFYENTQAIKDFETDHKLFPTEYRSSFADDEISDRMAFFRMNGGFYGRDSGTVCHPRFSVDATQRLFCGQSVTIINLQLAYWMGFSRVVLIGMDFSYTIPDDVERKGDLITSASDDVNHFHPDYFGKGKSWKDPKLDRVLVNYRLAGEMFAADGREIVNSTVGGNLDVFPRMDLLDAVGKR